MPRFARAWQVSAVRSISSMIQSKRQLAQEIEILSRNIDAWLH